MAFDLSDLGGELGGLLAGAYAAGAVMSFAFTKALFGTRVSELKADIARVETLQITERERCAEDMANLRTMLEEKRLRHRAEIERIDERHRAEMDRMSQRIDELTQTLLTGLSRQHEQVKRSAGEVIELTRKAGE